MKKYFIFAAIATAGLFASCSSSDDVAVSGGQEPIENSESREAIRLNLATPGAMTTRGTGTVGGVGTVGVGNGIANVWAGQTINVFMFTKGTEAGQDTYEAVPDQTTLTQGNTYYTSATGEGQFTAAGTEVSDGSNYFTKVPGTAANAYATTLNLTPAHEPGATSTTYLYDDQKMITPGSSENKIPGEATDDNGKGEAMIEDGTINYYPPQGNFDFFGYHADDAVTAAVDRTSAATTLWTVPFTINGTQDLMSTKAELTGDITETSSQKYIMAHAGTAGATAADPYSRSKDYYSAYAARKNVHPTLTFKHLLTRLQFSIIAGNKSAAGYVGETNAVNYNQAECDVHNAGLTGALGANEKVWTFEAGAPLAETQWPVNTTGFVKRIKEQDENTTTYTIVQCIKNTTGNNPDPDPFLNAYFALPATDLTALDFNQDVDLYAVTKNGDDYTINAAIAGVSLKGVQASTPAAYNATLSGAWNTSMEKTPAQAAHLDVLQAVKVKKIEVLSANTKGKMAVAWTADELADPNKITWDATQPDKRWLTLMDRPEYQKKDGAAAAEVADFTDLAARNTALNDQKTALQAELALITDQNSAAYTAKQAEIAAVTTLITALTDSATNREAAKITAETYALLTTAAQGAKYEAIANPKNEKLIALTPTSPEGTLSGTTFNSDPKLIGESIILSPGAYDANGVAQTGDAATEKIRMKVTLAQYVPTNWNHPDFLTEKAQEYELDIKAPAEGFKQNTSYNVKLTVYGLERIEVIAVVEPWDDGGNIEVGADD